MLKNYCGGDCIFIRLSNGGQNPLIVSATKRHSFRFQSVTWGPCYRVNHQFFFAGGEKRHRLVILKNMTQEISWNIK